MLGSPARAARTVGRDPRAVARRRTPCRAPCTSTTRSAASCSRAASATSSGPSRSPPRCTSGATPRARRCCGSVASARRARAGRSRRCSASPSSRRCSTARARVAADARDPPRRRASTALEQHDDHRRRRLRVRRPGSRLVRRRVRRRELDGARAARHRRRRSRVLLRLADRRRDPRRTAGVRSDQPPDLRSAPADDGRVGRARSPALGVHAPARRTARGAGRGVHRVEAARAVGRAPGQRAARTARGLHVPGPRRRPLAGRAHLPRRRCRAPDAAVRRSGNVLPGFATRPTSRGSSTSCSPGAPDRRCSRPTTRSAGRARSPRSTSRSSSARSSACPTRPRRRRATRRWRPPSPTRSPRWPICRGSRAAWSTPSSTRAGELFPQGDLGGRWFDDVHGAGWRLVTVDPDAGRSRSVTRRLVRLDRRRRGRCRAAPRRTSRRGSSPHDVQWALQRPDFHLYGTAADVAGAAELVEDLRRRLAR